MFTLTARVGSVTELVTMQALTVFEQMEYGRIMTSSWFLKSCLWEIAQRLDNSGPRRRLEFANLGWFFWSSYQTCITVEKADVRRKMTQNERR